MKGKAFTTKGEGKKPFFPLLSKEYGDIYSRKTGVRFGASLQIKNNNNFISMRKGDLFPGERVSPVSKGERKRLKRRFSCSVKKESILCRRTYWKEAP